MCDQNTFTLNVKSTLLPYLIHDQFSFTLALNEGINKLNGQFFPPDCAENHRNFGTCAYTVC